VGAQTKNIKYKAAAIDSIAHPIPPSLLLTIASTLSPFNIIKNGQSETNSTQNNCRLGPSLSNVNSS
jgi:hypothetical protein